MNNRPVFSRFSTRGLVGAVLLTLIASALSACGPGKPQQQVLRAADQRGFIRALLEASGELRDVPYRIEWSDFPAAAPLLEALKSDATDCGVAGDAPFLFAVGSNGAGIKAIAALRQSENSALAIFAQPSSNLVGIDSLRGKRIATTRGSIGHYLVAAALKKAGLGIDAVQLVFLSPADGKTALQSGAVDAWSTWDPYVAIAEFEGQTKKVLDATGLREAGYGYLVATDKAIASKREPLRDYVARVARSAQWATQHPQEYAALYSRLTGLPQPVALAIVTRADRTAVAIDDTVIASTQKTADLYADFGITDHRIAVAGSFDASFGGAQPTPAVAATETITPNLQEPAR